MLIIVNGVEFSFLNEECIAQRNIADTEPKQYDDSYLAEYEKRASSPIADKLMEFRKGFALKYAPNDTCKILDYGCGYAPIVRQDIALRNMNQPGAGRWHAWDINKACREAVASRWLNVAETRSLDYFGLVCFFDCLEHFQDLTPVLSMVPNRFVATVPCLPTKSWMNPCILQAWKHFKPGEHFIYATAPGWAKLFRQQGFSVLDITSMESKIGREHSMTFACERDE